jgi:cell fate (sporulation/competence/biofilm development) regulator YlbF (YheA/YmcA/DUF963 family)
MATQAEIEQKARALGEALAQSEVVQGYRAAEQAVGQDTEAQQLVQQYAQQAEQIRAQESSGQPVEPTDKQALGEVERAMAGNDALQQLMRWQADYTALMNSVNQAISAPITGASEGGSQQ